MGTTVVDHYTVHVEGWDRHRIIGVSLWVAKTMEYNPRRIKRFLNLFRLRAYLAETTEPKLIGPPGNDEQITLEQLGKFVAINLQWPRLLSDLAHQPDLLAKRYELVLRRELKRKWRDSTADDKDPSGEPVTDMLDFGTGAEEADIVDEVTPSVTTEDGNEAHTPDDSDAAVPDRDRNDDRSRAIDEAEPPAETDNGSGLSYLSERSLERLDELLVAGVYDEKPPGFRDLKDVVDPTDYQVLKRSFNPPDFNSMMEYYDDVEQAIEEIEVQQLESYTEANTFYSMANVNVQGLLRISPRTELEPELTQEELVQRAQKKWIEERKQEEPWLSELAQMAEQSSDYRTE